MTKRAFVCRLFTGAAIFPAATAAAAAAAARTGKAGKDFCEIARRAARTLDRPLPGKPTEFVELAAAFIAFEFVDWHASPLPFGFSPGKNKAEVGETVYKHQDGFGDRFLAR